MFKQQGSWLVALQRFSHVLKSSFWSTPSPPPPKPNPPPSVYKSVFFSAPPPPPTPTPLQLVCSSLVNVLNEVTRYECLTGQGLWGLPSLSQAWLSHPCHFFLLFQLLADLFVLPSTFSLSPLFRLHSVFAASEWLVFLRRGGNQAKANTVCQPQLLLSIHF